MKPLTSSDEFVAAAVNGQNEPRLLGIRLQLLPEVNDVGVYRARVGVVLIAPHLIQQAVAAERFRGMGYEVNQQRELLRRELDARAGAPHLITADVDLDVVEPIH